MNARIKKLYKENEAYIKSVARDAGISAGASVIATLIAKRKLEVTGISAGWADPDTKTLVEISAIQRNGQRTYAYLPVENIK